MKGFDGKRSVFEGMQFEVEGILDRDAPSLYMSVGGRDLYRLWADKVHLEAPLFRRGDVPEVLIHNTREALKSITNLDLVFGSAQNDAIPFLRAQVDAISLDSKFAARIVIQLQSDHEKTIVGHLPIRAGRVPEVHWIELQHLMAVLDIQKAYFVSTISGEQIVAVEVKRDLVFTSNHIAECIYFWDFVRRAEVPPKAVVPEEDKIQLEEFLASKAAQVELPLPEPKERESTDGEEN